MSAITLGERGTDSLLRLFRHSPAVGFVDRRRNRFVDGQGDFSPVWQPRTARKHGIGPVDRQRHNRHSEFKSQTESARVKASHETRA